jgi:hypothetical protein
MVFTFKSCCFAVCVLSLALSVNADTIRGALQRKLTDNVLLSSLGSNGSLDDPLPANSYTALGIVGLTGILYLDARDTANGDAWTFTFPAAFTTAALSEVVFVDPDTQPPVLYRASDSDDENYQSYAAKVTWLVSGPITLGATSFVGGTMKSGQTITLGATANSRSITGLAAITVGAGGTCGAIDAGAAITVGAGSFIDSLKAGGATTIGATVRCKDAPLLAWTTCAEDTSEDSFNCPNLPNLN